MFKEPKTAYLFLLPALVALIVFRISPIFISLRESLMFTGISGKSAFVGLENYLYLLTEDTVFWNSAKVTLLFSIIVNPLIVAVSLFFALLLNNKHPFTGFFRTVFFLPSAISFSVIAVIWGVILDPYYGLANSVLILLRLPPQPFLTSAHQALFCIILLCLWRSAGYWMMFFLAGLQGIPVQVYEAANLDGVSPLQQLFRITLPLLLRTISFVLVSNTAFNFLTFAPVYILTQGGPIGATNLLMYESYKSAFMNLDMGRANAISSILFLFILAISAIELRLTKTTFEY
jgi:multiple sugar transport system permease protein